MKYPVILWTIISCTACTYKPPVTVPLEPTRIWINESTHSDTIITGEGYDFPDYLYYAAKNWQISADTGLTHGYRNIAIRFGDSILVKPLADLTTNYDGPFFFQVNGDRTILQAQNFLDTTMPNDVRIFIPLY